MPKVFCSLCQRLIEDTFTDLFGNTQVLIEYIIGTPTAKYGYCKRCVRVLIDDAVKFALDHGYAPLGQPLIIVETMPKLQVIKKSDDTKEKEYS